ncbi:MAG TPA: replication-associated recombination protein A [Candidatus Polarisedimenticolia bacterium]|nr:replication-associated recombination protein A [Candidatus Polarisedimenticolia bacterium]
MRPHSLDEVVGQEAILGPEGALRLAIDQDRVSSLILWGPPGSGKTTLARLIAERSRARLVAYSAVLSGIREIKDVMLAAERASAAGDRRTILFVDEIHRFNRAQQDAFLPHVERGTIVLIGATTENPSFSINAALLSRCAVHVLEPIGEDDLVRLLRRALQRDETLEALRLEAADAELKLLASQAAGDARRALNLLEAAALHAGARPEAGRRLERADVERAAQRAALLYDREGEEHFNLISALHKSLRNSDADAAIYWLVRMLESGEDPLYIARRLIRFASEDVGNADPASLRMALSAKEAYEALGMPEGGLALAQAAAWLAAAPKSNAVYRAYGGVVEDLRAGKTDPVPLAVRNAPTPLMKNLGYGRGYVYAHDTEEGTADIETLPERLRGRRYYDPKPVGAEAGVKERLERMRAARERSGAGRPISGKKPERPAE